jgi:hypothetical protein
MCIQLEYYNSISSTRMKVVENFEINAGMCAATVDGAEQCY